MMQHIKKPLKKPNSPFFSSGPCKKHPDWSLSNLENAALGRSHRSQIGKQKLNSVIEESKSLLGLPSDYELAIVPASDTGAMEMALWSLLGLKHVDIYAWEAFSNTWLKDVANELKIPHTSYTCDYGDITDFSLYNPNNDTVFVYNGTTSGVRVQNLDWISDQREGLTICDATSAVFSQPIDFKKLDVITWSWQKALGGEGAHGMIALSPNAIKRLETYTPSWPMPKLFRLTNKQVFNQTIFTGSTINTPSLLCVEDALSALNWVRSIGGVKETYKRSNKNLEIIESWAADHDWVDFLAKDKAYRSNTSICLSIIDPKFKSLDEKTQRTTIKAIASLLEDESVAYDIAGYKSAPPGLRIWGGATVSPDDIALLLPWVTWAVNKVLQ